MFYEEINEAMKLIAGRKYFYEDYYFFPWRFWGYFVYVGRWSALNTHPRRKSQKGLSFLMAVTQEHKEKMGNKAAD